VDEANDADGPNNLRSGHRHIRVIRSLFLKTCGSGLSCATSYPGEDF